MITTMADDPVRLRPFREEDLDVSMLGDGAGLLAPLRVGRLPLGAPPTGPVGGGRFLEKDPHHLGVVEGNGPAKCGFEREGVLRQGGWRGGAWRDVWLYGRLRE
jgi:hypothetical protein